MARNRQSAKAAGSRFERQIADALAAALGDDRIDRRARNGAKDRGDIAGIRLQGQRVVIECKDTATMRLPEWTLERPESKPGTMTLSSASWFTNGTAWPTRWRSGFR